MDEENQQLTIRTIDDKEMVVKLERSATITSEGKQVKFSDLKPDQGVIVYYKARDNENWADSIRILSRKDI